MGAEQFGTEQHFLERTINHLELEMLDSRDALVILRDATANTARTNWVYHAYSTPPLILS